MQKLSQKVVLSWSGGKDSAYALYEILKTKQYEVLALLTNVVIDENKVKMHGIPLELLESQAASLGLPLEIIWVSSKSKNGEYLEKTGILLEKYKAAGVTGIVFGDLFLADIKAYRDQCCETWGMKGIYPLWERPTTQLAQDMLKSGFKTVLTCVDTTAISQTFAGQEYNENFLKELPNTADPCGENGEFHTFVYDGPILEKKIHFMKHDYYMKDDRFYYCELKA